MGEQAARQVAGGVRAPDIGSRDRHGGQGRRVCDETAAGHACLVGHASLPPPGPPCFARIRDRAAEASGRSYWLSPLCGKKHKRRGGSASSAIIDRKSVVSGKNVAVRVDLGGCR